MVEDNQIKAQVSPFAIREGEIKTFDGKDGYVSMNQIVHKINIRTYYRYSFCYFGIGKWIWVYYFKTIISNARDKGDWP